MISLRKQIPGRKLLYSFYQGFPNSSMLNLIFYRIIAYVPQNSNPGHITLLAVTSDEDGRFLPVASIHWPEC